MRFIFRIKYYLILKRRVLCVVSMKCNKLTTVLFKYHPVNKPEGARGLIILNPVVVMTNLL